MAEPLVIFVDVDDTLVRSVGTERVPIQRVVEHVRDLAAGGAQLYCWSTGGSTYAHEAAVELGLEDCFVAFLPKPNVLLDDQEVSTRRRCIQVHPMSAGGLTAEDYSERITTTA